MLLNVILDALPNECLVFPDKEAHFETLQPNNLPKLKATSTKMTELYRVTTDEKEFKIPHVNLAYNHGMVRIAFYL